MNSRTSRREFLADLGVASDRIVFLPSHANGPGPQASDRHRARWAVVDQPLRTFDDLARENPLEDWFADLIGPLSEHVNDTAGVLHRFGDALHSALDIGNKHIVSAVTYNSQFPGPLLRFKEGEPVTVEIHNDTDTQEQLHWHGQFVSPDVDGAAEEGTPFIPAHGMRRVTFTPRPAGFRFYHTHNRAGSDLHAGQYSGQVGPLVEDVSGSLSKTPLRRGPRAAFTRQSDSS